MPQDKLQILYDMGVKHSASMPPFEEFADKMKDGERQRQYYGWLSQKYDLSKYPLDKFQTEVNSEIAIDTTVGLGRALATNLAKKIQAAPLVPTAVIGGSKEAQGLMNFLFALPQELMTAAIPSKDETFAQKIEREKRFSELLPESTPEAVKVITDIVADPLLLPVGKIAAAGKALRAIRKVPKPKVKVPPAPKPVAPKPKIEVVSKRAKLPEPEIGKIGKAQFKSFTKEEQIGLKFYAKRHPDRVERARRGVQTHEETEMLATKMKEETAAKLEEGFYKPGTALNAAEAHAVKQNIADDMINVFDTIIKEEPSKKVEQLFGIVAEKGRALEAEKIMIPINQKTLEKIREQIAKAPKHIKPELEKIAKHLGLNKREISPTLLDKFVEFATMIKLTGLSTHVRAIGGNAGQIMLRVPEKLVHGTLDTFLWGATLGKYKRNVRAVEALPELWGGIKAFRNGSSKAWSMLVHPSKYFDEATKAGEVFIRGGAIGGKTGEAVRSPGRLIGAVDVFAKEINKGAEIYALATRIALTEKRRGADLFRRFSELITNPTPKMIEKAKSSALERVFQERLTGLAQDFNVMRKKQPLLRLIVPFWNTPVNLLKQSLQRTPLTVFLPSTVKAFKPGASTERKLELISRMITGSALMTGMTLYAMEGRISGAGPRSKNKANAMRLTGWSPYAVKIGEDWVGYRGFEPISSWLRFSANAAEGLIANDKYDAFAGRIINEAATQFAQNPFLMGIHDIQEAMEGRGDWARFGAGLVTGSTIPVVLQQWGTRVYDPIIRNPQNWKERILARVPFGPSKGVRPLRTIFGDEIKRDKPKAQALGFLISTPKGGKVEKEMSRLSQLENGLSLSKPSPTVNNQKLTPDEHERFVIGTGVMLKQFLEKYVNSPGYDVTPDAIKIKTITVMRNTARNLNAAMLFPGKSTEPPQLLKELTPK